MEAADYAAFKARMYADLDRQSNQSTKFTEILNFQFAGAQAFRDANAARVVLESGSGQSRAMMPAGKGGVPTAGATDA